MAMLFFSGIGVGVGLSLKPWETYRDKQEETKQYNSAAQKIERENSEKSRAKNMDEQPFSAERKARRLGLVPVTPAPSPAPAEAKK